MNLEPINEAQLEFIKNEDFYRSTESLEEDVTQLIEWLSKQPHLPNITDRKWLLHFIIGCKFNLQRSKQVIESYLVVRAEYPEYFGSSTKEQIDKALKAGSISILPKMTPEGYRVFCLTTKHISEEDPFDAMHFFRSSLYLLDLHLRQEASYGHVFVFDEKHLSPYQLLAFTPTITKKFFRCAIDSFPIRVKAVHFLNPPKFMGRVLTFFKMFLPNKIKKRLYVHETIEDLYQFIPKDVLPDLYGGTGGNLKKIEDDLVDLALKNSEWLEARPKADLSRRPIKSIADELDMNGTFKKLQID